MTRPQFTAKRPQVGVGVVLLAVLGGLGLRFALADDDPIKQGSLGFTTFPLDKGEGFTVGLAIRDAGDKAVEILEVKANTSPNLEFLGVIPGGPGPGAPWRGSRERSSPAR